MRRAHCAAGLPSRRVFPNHLTGESLGALLLKQTMLQGVRTIHVIACGVLGLDLRAVAERLPQLEITTEFLPGGLHETPQELRRTVQEAIDRAAREQKADLLAIGYGVCGLGTVGLSARTIPLAIPRVNDCIALFLGSDEAYRHQFARQPGTYYIADGWVAEKANPLAPRGGRKGDAPSRDEQLRDDLIDAHGQDNAEAIQYFLNSWQRNYRRAAYIDTGLDARRKHAAIARDMAERYGWQYEELQGTHRLLEALLTTRQTTDEILIVPPHHVTAFDPTGRTLMARPAWQDSQAPSQRTLTLTAEPPADPRPGRAVRLGLGIDAGGTCTDVAVYDFATREVLAKAKAPTTPWNYAIGIGQALEQLPAEKLAAIEMVSVSTTLATNALVEGRGQKVAMLIWPPYGLFHEEDFTHRPLACLTGKLEIDGREIEPVDPEQIARIARQMVAEHNVRAFAVTGFASHVNPAHELAAMEIIRRETNLAVTCGHEVSRTLNYKVRAETAMLNTRIIPYLDAMLQQVAACLAGHDVSAPIMVVRSDGALMTMATARTRPIETILSGPAASMAGAHHLAGCDEALVVDIGGTTTDSSVIAGGQVRTCAEGARVGSWRTHVQALDIRTQGLGGDSAIVLRRGELTLGPRRHEPIGSLAGRADVTPAMDWIERHLDRFDASTEGMAIVQPSPQRPAEPDDERQAAILDALADRPMCIDELAQRLDYVGWEFMPLAAMQDAHLISLSGLTPTDLLHVVGRVSLWEDCSAADRLAELTGRLAGVDRHDLARRVEQEFVRRLTMELIETQMAQSADKRFAIDDAIEPDLRRASPFRALMENLLAGGSDDYRVGFEIPRPIVGIGAPAGHFLPASAGFLGAEAVIPPHAEVANAVGAITSEVVIRRQVEIVPDETGRFVVQGLADAPAFGEIDDAQAYALEVLAGEVRQAARANGTSQQTVEVTLKDRTARASDGSVILLGRDIAAELRGRPDLIGQAND